MDDDAAWDLEMELLCLPASGGSVRSMQRLAERVCGACDNVPQHVRELGSLPASSHRERDMHRWVSKQAWRRVLPSAYEFLIPFTPDQIKKTTIRHYALLPHEVFESLSGFPELFELLLTGPPGALSEFWRHSSRTLWHQRHPIDAVRSQPAKCVPVGIHGDDASVYGQSNSVLILTWGSVVQELVTLDSRILFAGVLLKTAVPGETLECLYKVLAWSLNCLAEGLHPAADHDGRPFSREHHPERYAKRGQPLNQSGFRGIWSELRGDWKWQVESLHLDQYYNTNFCCHLCRAHWKIKRLWFTQFRRNSHLRRTRVSWRAFRDWYADRYEKPHLFGIIGFDIWRCWCDAMHCLDLGVYQSVAASCLAELCAERVWGVAVSEGDQYAVAHTAYKEWCVRHGQAACPRFEKDKLWKSQADFPKFSQQTAKASATRYLIRWLRSVLDMPGISAGVHGSQRLAMMDSFVSFENVCEGSGRWLSPADQEAIAFHLEAALVNLNSLAVEAFSQGLFLWHLQPKAHMMTHLAYDFAATGVNPRRTTCYADEDMIGRCKKIVQHCHGATAGRSLVLRYAILVGTRWWTRLAELRGVRA